MKVQAADLDPNKIGFATVPKWVELAPMPATIDTAESLDVLYVLRDNKKLNRLVKDNIKLFQQETALDKGMYQEVWQALVILEDIRDLLQSLMKKS
jgi:hypothetical protein